MKRLALTLLAACAAFATSAVAAPVPYAGGTYTQDFNGLPVATTGPGIVTTITGRGPHDINGTYGTLTATGMEGWTMSNNAGSSTNTEYRAHNGSVAGSAGRGVISFGTINSTDRALGTLATSNQISRFGLVFLNNSATTYNAFDVSFAVEQWRQGEVGVQNTNLYDYAVSSDSLDNINTAAIFTNYGSYGTPNPAEVGDFGEIALDGNLSENQIAVTDSVSGISWAPGQWLLLRWNGQDVTGQDNGLSIDNFSFTASVVPEPTGLGLATIGLAAYVARRRR
jgi:hypothetical protein